MTDSPYMLLSGRVTASRLAGALAVSETVELWSPRSSTDAGTAAASDLSLAWAAEGCGSFSFEADSPEGPAPVDAVEPGARGTCDELGCWACC